MPIYSYDRYSAPGDSNAFNITFDYLSSAHIEVYLDGVKQESGFSIDSSANTVTFTSTPASGAVVLIKRVTPKDKTTYQAQIADFTDGSVLTAKDLDNASLGLLFIAQEAEDSGATNSLSIDQSDLNWDAENKRIKNVGTPTGSADAATKSYVDGQALYNSPTVPQVYTFTATASQTSFNLDPQPTSSDPDSFFVDIDGVMQKPTTDFTVSGSTLTLTTGASADQVVTVRNIGVTRDIMGDNPSVSGNLSVSGTLGVTGATTMSSTLGVTGATTMTGGVSGNLNLLTGALQVAGTDVMTIRQITTGTVDTSQNGGGESHQIDGTSGSDNYIFGLSTTITPASTNSKIILIASPTVYAGVDDGQENDINCNVRIHYTTGGSTITAGQPSTFTDIPTSLTKIFHRSTYVDFGESRAKPAGSAGDTWGGTHGGSPTNTGVVPDPIPYATKPGAQIDTVSNFDDIHTHVHELPRTVSSSALLYQRLQMIHVFDVSSTSAHRFEVTVQMPPIGETPTDNNNFVRCLTDLDYSNFYAIEIG